MVRGAILLTLCVVASAADKPVPVLTVCEALSDLPRYQGQTVIIVGRSAGTEEGSWLDEECGSKLINGGRAFGSLISTSYVGTEFAPAPELPLGFIPDGRSLRKKLMLVQHSTRLPGRGYRWAALFGRLETQLPVNCGRV